ncbi:hypothetical protein [Dactylosporangium salmoneum]
MQDLLPHAPGRATTLFSNTFPAGQLMAGPLLGLAQQFSYRLAFGIGAAMCTTGLLILLLLRPKVRAAAVPAAVAA